jgi:hypothetical protein
MVTGICDPSSIAKSRLRPAMGQRFLLAGRKAWFLPGSPFPRF